MKLFQLLTLLMVLCNCNSNQNKLYPTPQVASSVVASTINYDSCKNSILLIKKNKKSQWLNISKTEKEKIFTAAVTETIIPKWIGTAWDFNGITEKPQDGSIACGYFVTTVLRDAGLNLARIKLAQCASEQMIVTLVQPKYIQRFSNVPMGNFVQAILDKGFGLYIVGLDNHTGFIYNNGKDIYFIHSTFIGTRNVQKEKASESWILEKSKYKVLGKISSDEKILERWIN